MQTVVSIKKPCQDEILVKLDEWRERAEQGTLATIFYVAIDEKGNWTANWVGEAQDRLKSVGCLESLKWELFFRAENA